MALEPDLKDRQEKREDLANLQIALRDTQTKRKDILDKFFRKRTVGDENTASAIAQAKEKEGEGNSVVKTDLQPITPATVDVGNPAAGVGKDSKFGLGQSPISGTETTSTVPAAGSEQGSGLPPRNLTSTTTREHPVFNFLDKSSSRTDPNPQFKQELQNRSISIGNAAFSLANGDMRPDRFAPFVLSQLEGMTPAEKKMVMVQSQQTSVAKMASQTALDRAVGASVGFDTVQNYPSLGGQAATLSHARATARTAEERRKATDDFAKAIFNSKEAKDARGRQAAEDHLNETNSKISDLRLEQIQYETSLIGPLRDQSLAKAKTGEFMDAAGVVDDRTPEAINTSIGTWKKTPFTEELRGLIEQDQRAALRIGRLVPMVSKEGIIADPAFTNFDFRLFQKYTHALGNKGFTKQGHLAGGLQDVDNDKTEEIFQQALNYVAGFGMSFRENGELFVPKDNPNRTVLMDAMGVIEFRDLYEGITENSVPNVYDFPREFVGGVTLPPLQGPKESKPALTGTAGGRQGKRFSQFISGVNEGARRRSRGRIRGRPEAAGAAFESVGTNFSDFIEEANKSGQ